MKFQIIGVTNCVKALTCFSLKIRFSGQPEKIADLVGSGGKFFFSQPKKTKPVGEFEVQKSLGTISGLRCPELEAPPATKMVCTNQERA